MATAEQELDRLADMASQLDVAMEQRNYVRIEDLNAKIVAQGWLTHNAFMRDIATSLERRP